MAQKVVEGPTPSGGVKTVLIFSDEDGKPVEESEAANVEIIEYDAENNIIKRSYVEKK